MDAPAELLAQPPDGPDPRLTILRALLILQAGTFVAGVVEALVFGAVLGPSGLGGAVLGAAATIVVLVTRARLPGRRANRVLLVVEGAIVAGWILELVLGIVLTGVLPPPMAWLSRLVLPAAVIALARVLAREAAAREAAARPTAAADLQPPPPPTRWLTA